MRTKLTLEQKRLILNLIGRFNFYLKSKAEKYYRYDVFQCANDNVIGTKGFE